MSEGDYNINQIHCNASQRGAYIGKPVTGGAYIKVFLYCVALNWLCRFSSTLTDVHMDTSTKLATFSLEEEVLTEYIPKHVELCGL